MSKTIIKVESNDDGSWNVEIEGRSVLTFTAFAALGVGIAEKNLDIKLILQTMKYYANEHRKAKK